MASQITEYQEPPPRHRLLRLALVIVLLLAAGLFILLSVRSYLNVPEVRVPKVVGVNLDDAYRALRALHLEVSTFPEESGTVPDSVVSQNPEPGVLVRRGHEVSLGVYTPTAQAPMPDLLGKDQAEVKTALDSLNMDLSEVSYDYSGEPVGTVIAQAPPPGSALTSTSSLKVVLSRGPKVRRVKLPDLDGLSLNDAKQQLATLGVTHVETIASSLGFFNDELVTAQMPRAGQSVPVTGTVTLFYTLSESRVVKVPHLAGESLAQAQLILQAAGLKLGWITYVQNSSKPQGVLSVQPADYTLVGSPVRLTVNGTEGAQTPLLPPSTLGTDARLEPPFNAGGPTQTAPIPPTASGQAPQAASTPQASPGQGVRTIRITFDPANLPFLKGKSYRFKLVVTDDRGKRDAIDQQLDAGESVNTTVPVYGKAQMQTYINGIFYQAWNP